MAKAKRVELSEQIAGVIEEYLAECRASAVMAVQSSFGAMQKPKRKHVVAAGVETRRGRRASDETKQLTDRFYAAIQAVPGQTMIQLSKSLGAPSTLLHPCGRRLRDEGLVHTAGKLQRMRYFPVAKRSLSRNGAA